MRQLVLDRRSGVVQVVDVPVPSLDASSLLVRTVRSVVSPGTERATVMAGRDSYLKTARNRPDLVRQVLDNVKREGVLSTYRKVRTRMGESRPLGYSSAGVVEAVGVDATI